MRRDPTYLIFCAGGRATVQGVRPVARFDVPETAYGIAYVYARTRAEALAERAEWEGRITDGCKIAPAVVIFFDIRLTGGT